MGSQLFQVYDRNLRRMFWLSFIDEHMKDERRKQFRASLVGAPCREMPAFAHCSEPQGPAPGLVAAPIAAV